MFSRIKNKSTFPSLFMKYKAKFSSNSSGNDKQRLAFIFLTAGLGGACLGYSITSYVNSIIEKKQPQQTKWDTNWDKKEDLLEEKEKLGTKYITLVRHGQYVHAKEKENKKLTELGRIQALECGKRLKEISPKFDKIFVSDMVRAKETCGIISPYFENVKCIEDPLLTEGYPCEIEPEYDHLKHIKEKCNKDKHGKRISTAFEKYFTRCDGPQDQHELYVVHGNVIRYFLCRSLQFDPRAWLRFSIFHCGITQLKISPNGNVTVQRVGDTGYLKQSQITYK